MGILSRIGTILRSYAHSTTDRIERVAVEEEIRQAKARKEAEEEMKALELEPVAQTPRQPRIQPPIISTELASDYRLLGVRPGADLDAVEAAWHQLVQRADPKRFPAGSEEEKKAAEILKKINEAYVRIREHLNPTEGRFGQLEL